MARPTKYAEHRDQVLTLVQKAAERHAAPPTVRFLADELQVGVATMHSYLGKLAEEGLLEWTPKSHRSLRVTQQGSLLLSSPPTAQP